MSHQTNSRVLSAIVPAHDGNRDLTDASVGGPAAKEPLAAFPNTLKYTPLEHIKVRRPVDRIAFISTACRNKKVLDLGALDETAFTQKTGHGSWLHEEITKVAESAIGLDSSMIVPEDGLVTAENGKILRGTAADIGGFLAKIDFQPDIVVAGEFIEHLDNPLDFLRSIRSIPRLKGATLLLSTPNATAVHNCLIALANRESTHHDHLCILSFKTLSTLMSRAGYVDWEIIPYHADFAEMRQRNNGAIRRLVAGGQMMINLIETIFPLMSFGLLVHATI